MRAAAERLAACGCAFWFDVSRRVGCWNGGPDAACLRRAGDFNAGFSVLEAKAGAPERLRLWGDGGTREVDVCGVRLTLPDTWSVRGGRDECAPDTALVLDGVADGDHLTLRAWQSGDRFQPAWRRSASTAAPRRRGPGGLPRWPPGPLGQPGLPQGSPGGCRGSHGAPGAPWGPGAL